MKQMQEAEREIQRQSPQRTAARVRKPNGSQMTVGAERDGTRSKSTYRKWVIALCAVLFLSLVVMLGITAVLHYRAEQRREEIRAQEELNAEKLYQLALAKAQSTTVEPVAEPQIPHAAYTADTGKITGIESEYAILIDVSDNTVVADKNGTARIYPASMTKVMTLIVAYEHIADLNALYTFDYKVTDPPYKAGASIAGFSVGESVPLLDVLYGAALPSGADATLALADYVAGSEEVFAGLMNEKAEAMGLTETHFMNASGLHDKNHYSTPQEMAMILEYAMAIPTLRDILSTYKYTTAKTDKHPDGILLVSTMFSRMYGDEAGNCEVIAGKTGYTNEAKNCLASFAKTPDGRTYILVTAFAAGSYAPIFDAIDVYKKYIPEV